MTEPAGRAAVERLIENCKSALDAGNHRVAKTWLDKLAQQLTTTEQEKAEAVALLREVQTVFDFSGKGDLEDRIIGWVYRAQGRG